MSLYNSKGKKYLYPRSSLCQAHELAFSPQVPIDHWCETDLDILRIPQYHAPLCTIYRSTVKTYTRLYQIIVTFCFVHIFTTSNTCSNLVLFTTEDSSLVSGNQYEGRRNMLSRQKEKCSQKWDYTFLLDLQFCLQITQVRSIIYISSKKSYKFVI